MIFSISWASLFQSVLSDHIFFKIRFTLSSNLLQVLPNAVFPSCSPTKRFHIYISLLRHTCYMPDPLHPRSFGRFYKSHSSAAHTKSRCIEWRFRRSQAKVVTLCDALWLAASILPWQSSASDCIGRLGLENNIMDIARFWGYCVTLYQLLILRTVKLHTWIKLNDECGRAVWLELFRYSALNIRRVTWLHDGGWRFEYQKKLLLLQIMRTGTGAHR